MCWDEVISREVCWDEGISRECGGSRCVVMKVLVGSVGDSRCVVL